MAGYIIFGVLFTIMCYCYRGQERQSETVFFIGILITLIFAAIRYGFGGDYFIYETLYEGFETQGGDLVYYSVDSDEFLERRGSERFFYILLRAFPSYMLFVAVHAFTWFCCFYYVIRKNVEYEHFALVAFLLYFDSSGMMINLSGLRTGLVTALFIIAYSLLLRETKLSKLLYIAIILLASRIHQSAVFLLIGLFFTGKNRVYNNGKYAQILSIITIVMVIILWLFNVRIVDTVTNTFVSYLPQNFEKYTHYLDSFNHRTVGIGNLISFAIRSIPIFVLITALTKETERKYILTYKMAIFALFGIIAGGAIFARFHAMLFPIIIIAVCRSFRHVSSEYKLLAIFSLVFSAIISFAGINFNDGLHQYQTIFSAPSFF